MGPVRSQPAREAGYPPGNHLEGPVSLRRRWIWGLPALLYFVFFTWYTDLGGPLTGEEIESFSEQLAAVELPPEGLARLRRFMEEDTGRQFLMVNVLDENAAPPRVEGAPADATAQDLMALYMEHMFPQLLRRACHPVTAGTAVANAMDLVGLEGAERWTAGALMRYRSRRDFMEIVAMPETHARHDFKVAALAKTVAFPIETRLYLGDPRWLLGLVLLSGAGVADALLGRRT